MMRRFIQGILCYRASLLACIIAFIFLLPQMLFHVLEPGARGGIYLSLNSDEEHYASLIQEVSEGKLLHRNTYLYEEKQGKPNIYMFGESVFGVLYMLWPFGIASFIFFLKWFGCAGTIYLLIHLSQRLRPQGSFVWHSIAAVSFFVFPMMLGPKMVTMSIAALRLEGSWKESITQLRFFNPVMTNVLWLGSVVVCIRAWQERSRKLAVLGGVIIGALSWFYVYFWVYMSVVLGLFFLTRLFRKEREAAKLVGYALLADLAVSIPHVLFVMYQMSIAVHPVALPVATRASMVSVAALTSFALFFGVRVLIQGWRFQTWALEDDILACLALGTIVATNQHLVTGYTLQPHHFYFFVSLPMASVFLAYAIGDADQWMRRHWNRWKSWVGLAMFILMLWMGFGIQVSSVRAAWSEFLDRQRFAFVFARIREMQMPYVVLSDERISELIPMYTRADVYYAPHAAAYESTSMERRIHAWYVRSRLEGLIDPSQVYEVFASQRDLIGILVFEGQYWRDRCGRYGCFPESDLDRMVNGYLDFLRQDFRLMLQKYRIDAIVWDEKRNPMWMLERYPFLEKRWSDEEVSLWTIRPM